MWMIQRMSDFHHRASLAATIRCVVAIAALCVTLSSPADAGKRSMAERRAFCAETGFPGCHRPGYVVDHIWPLCDGGADDRTNMQWQRVADSKAKDKWERLLCRNPRSVQ